MANPMKTRGRSRSRPLAGLPAGALAWVLLCVEPTRWLCWPVSPIFEKWAASSRPKWIETMDQITRALVIRSLRSHTNWKVLAINEDPCRPDALTFKTIAGDIRLSLRQEDDNLVVVIGRRELVIKMSDVLGKPN